MAFTASQLLKIQLMANDMWADSRIQTDYIAECDVAKALMSETTAQLAALQDPNKTRTLRLIWAKTDQMTDAAVDDDCAITGPELSSDYTEYTIDIFRKTSFSVKGLLERRTDEFDLAPLIAQGFLKADKILSEYLAEVAVAKLEAFRGTNTYLNPVGDANPWTFASSDTTIPAEQWNTSLMPKLSLTARKMKMMNPALISGEALWYMNEEAANNRGNDSGKGDATRMDSKYFARKYFDPIKIDEVNAGAIKAYMVDRGAIAMVTKSHYPGTPMLVQNPWQQRYQIESRNLPGVFWEVTYTQACTSSEILHTFQLKVNGLIALNPLGETAANTGVFSFVRPTSI